MTFESHRRHRRSGARTVGPGRGLSRGRLFGSETEVPSAISSALEILTRGGPVAYEMRLFALETLRVGFREIS